MKLDVGKYSGQDLADVPTDYLEWAVGHLRMSDSMGNAVVAEYARRANEERVSAETPAQRVWERVQKTVTKFTANHPLPFAHHKTS